ncbi:MCE family protein [Actinomadura algeriensis]|uniref:Phospholipid/cholesterol/gamma-HCH transport system substrate-binding protein n=1 Tax=Actinomadura algeriensis TaxID=1679523 RepID=A0ABR9JRE1_9ACTN|nr:MCE family protein [Actinomadura algeriensis]MBE1533127.1 phospholipid/cholesterol/gamma-HCH transport system substrate-binding protein [Actinomadura algeriensis]
MKQPRIVINLVFFAGLGVVLAIWAVSSIISIDALERPYRVTVQFATSPGLRADQEVTHLGVHVGTVGGVELRDGHVDVRLDLDRGTDVPAGVGARVLRKSAIGEPYIELTPPPRAGGGSLEEGDLIPVNRTKATVDYQQLFSGLGETLKAVDPRDARTLVHEAAAGLEGRGGSLNSIIGDSHQLTRTLAADAGTLDALAVELTRLTSTLTDHRLSLASGANDLATVTATIGRERAHLETVLDEGPGAIAGINELLRRSRPGLGCLLTAAATPSDPLLTSANSAKIRHVLEMVPTLKALVTDITARDATGPYLRVTPVITVTGEAPTEYADPRPRPKAPELTTCAERNESSGGDEGGDERDGERRAAEPAAPSGTGSTPGADPAMSSRPVNAGDEPSGGGLPLWPPVLAGLVLLAAAVRTVRTMRIRKQK